MEMWNTSEADIAQIVKARLLNSILTSLFILLVQDKAKEMHTEFSTIPHYHFDAGEHPF